MKSRTAVVPPVLVLCIPVLLASCSGTGKGTGFANSGSSGSSGDNSSGGAFSSDPSFGGDAGPSGADQGCHPDPKNAEVADNHCDDDGDGAVDNVPTCDTGLAVDGDPTAFARAIALCDDASKRGFGLVSATYANGFGRTNAPSRGQWGILPKFGSVLKPREGASLAALSSGYAREFDSLDGSPDAFAPGIEFKKAGAAPSGFPKAAGNCDQDNHIFDAIDVKLVIKAPPNVKGFTFDFNFHSSEWPLYVCSSFNDAFIAYLSAQGFNGGKPDNISFDSKNAPVSVNNGFFDRCTSNSPTGCVSSKPEMAACPGGPGELAGTGFGLTALGCDFTNFTKQTMGGATGWLTTQAPVQAGETFTLEFLIWDAGDSKLDSLVLIDHFAWVGAPVQAGTTRPPK